MGALIYDYTVPTTTTSINLSIPNLNIQKGELYELTATYTTASASYTNYNLFINNNTTESDYVFQYLNAGGSSPYAGRVSYAGIFGTSGNTTGQSHSYLKLTNNGRFVWQSEFSTKVGSSTLEVANHFGSSTFTVSSITALTLTAKATDGIAAGTRIQLRKVGDLVNDVEVTTATTNVTLQNLNIKKDDEYILVADRFNPTSNSAIRLFANNNTTLTNYWRQFIYGTGSTVSGTRVNESSFGYSINNHWVLSVAKIKLTNTGYFTVQSSYAADYSTGSGLYIGKQYMTSTFQTTKIDSLTITSEAANGLGIGSRFELYKLYEEPVVQPNPDTYELLAEHTVYSPTTQIDIPVNITKDDEVRLVFTFVGDSSSTSTDVSVYPNDLTTGTNYYRQTLQGFGTSTFVARQNNGICFYGRSNIKTAGFVDIKVSNNDRFVAQSQFTVYVGSESSGMGQYNANIVGTQTVSSITKLSIVGSRTNGIAVGSKIQLFKVN